MLKLGDMGPEVREVQFFLMEQGFLAPEYDASGDLRAPEYNYGVKTKLGVMNIQEFLKTERNGVWYEQNLMLYQIKMRELGYSVEPGPVSLFRQSRSGGSDDFYYYTVKQGDCLWNIAKRELGDPYRWRDIYNLNLGQISNPSLVYPGQKLKIPKDSKSQSNDRDTSTGSTEVSTGGNYTKTTPAKGTKFSDLEIECYIINLNTSKKITFGIAPESISDTNLANFEDELVRGRSSPFKGYSGSGPREISFTINLYADYCPDGIVQTERAIRALVYPEKSSVVIPPRCLFHVGSFINVTGVPVSVSTEWKKPFKDNIYAFADVTITLNQVDEVSRRASEVERNG